MRRRVAAHVLAALALLAPAAHAGEPTERLRALFERANGILTATEPSRGADDRLAAIRALVSELFDARGAAAAALGQEWQTRTAPQRAEFARLYAELVERAYLSWVGTRARVHEDGVHVAFVSESTTADAATVVTTLAARGADDVPVEYRMRRRDGRWLVQDVIVDGLSLADSYRVQFRRVLQDGGWAELVARMYERVAPGAPVEAAVPIRVASAPAVADAPPADSSPLATAVLPVEPAPPSRPTPEPPTVSVPPRAASPASSRGAQLSPTMRATAPAAAAARQPKSFWLQLGAFRDTDAAARLIEHLRDRRATLAIDAQRPGALARVLVGPFVDRTAAAAALRQLTAAGYRAFIALE